MFRTFAQLFFSFFFFFSVAGGMKETFGNSGGEGGYFSSEKNEIPERIGVLCYLKFPLWWGYGVFWNHTVPKQL